MTHLNRLLRAVAVAALLFVPATGLAESGEERRTPAAGPVTVSAIGPDTARVTAMVTLSSNSSAAFWFEYGTSAALGRQTAAATATAGDADGGGRMQVSQTLTGLTPATLHHVRLVASASGGRGNGATTTFTTAAAGAPAPHVPEPEPAPPAPGAPTVPADAAPRPAPALGASFVAAAERGSVRVRLPGGDRFVDLPEVASLPVGTVVDARQGAIVLSTALADGSVQDGRFRGARFKVLQAAHAGGRTDLHLRGRLACRPNAGGARALASAGGKPPKVRRLWGRDRGGRFRTHGRDSVTTVRGTRWSVTDRCDGTVTKVTEGAVDVRVRRSGRVVRLDAGERFFARHRR